MTYLTSMQLVCLPLVIVGGLFGMNVKVPFQEFLEDENNEGFPERDHLKDGFYELYEDFTWEWWLNSLLPLLPFFSIVVFASTVSTLFYVYFK